MDSSSLNAGMTTDTLGLMALSPLGNIGDGLLDPGDELAEFFIR